jgi:hypothetical protein
MLRSSFQQLQGKWFVFNNVQKKRLYIYIMGRSCPSVYLSVHVLHLPSQWTLCFSISAQCKPEPDVVRFYCRPFLVSIITVEGFHKFKLNFRRNWKKKRFIAQKRHERMRERGIENKLEV